MYMPAKVRKILQNAKRQSWQKFCNTMGRSTPVGEVWDMIKCVRGIRREWKYLVMKVGQKAAASDEEKAEMLAKALIEIHSSNNKCSCGSVVEHCVSSANGCGFNSQ